MAAKRIAQSSINWASIAERVPPEQKHLFVAFKAKSDTYLRRVTALPENPPKIDWALYKGKVPLPAMVDEFQKKYDSFKIPVPDDAAALSQIATEEKESKSRIENFKKESAARIVEYQKELETMLSTIPIVEMTMEEYAYAYPHLALDPINNPTFWPHGKEDNPTPEEEAEMEKHREH